VASCCEYGDELSCSCATELDLETESVLTSLFRALSPFLSPIVLFPTVTLLVISPLLEVTHFNLSSFPLLPHSDVGENNRIWRVVDQNICIEGTRNGKNHVQSKSLLMQSVHFLSDFDGEWTANQATVVQCAEPVQRHCECSASIPRFKGVN
jgi:hypothetical protein